jgi:hypothetical protein
LPNLVLVLTLTGTQTITRKEIEMNVQTVDLLLQTLAQSLRIANENTLKLKAIA